MTCAALRKPAGGNGSCPCSSSPVARPSTMLIAGPQNTGGLRYQHQLGEQTAIDAAINPRYRSSAEHE